MFSYSPSAEDYEMDEINYTLDVNLSPSNMTIDHELGTVTWRPGPWDVGENYWVLVLRDGKDERRYNFSLTVINEPDPPMFITPPPFNPEGVLVGETFTYNFTALDPDPGDRVTYIIVYPVQGAGIDVQTGLFSWTPPQHFQEPVKFVIRARDSDGNSADLEFELNTTFIDNPPILGNEPETTLYDTQKWTFPVQLVDPEDHRIEVELFESPEGMEYDVISQNITWTPSVTQVGEFNLSIQVISTRFEIFFNFTLEVLRSPREWSLTIQGLEPGKTLKGKVQIGGELTLSPSTIQEVQIKIGDNDWIPAFFAEGRWSYDLNTKDYKDGEYLIKVRAFDGAVYSNEQSILVNFKNKEEETSPLIFILIAIIVIVLIVIAVVIFLFLKKVQEKKEQEEVKKRQEEAIIASKKSMKDFLQETGSDLDANVDYSSIDLHEGDEGKDLSKIDEIFQPLNIPKDTSTEIEEEIPEDPLLREDKNTTQGPQLGESLDLPSESVAMQEPPVASDKMEDDPPPAE
jgi:hypothetical protein